MTIRMKKTPYKSNIRTIQSSAQNFWLQDGITRFPRAGFEIDLNCPVEYRKILLMCIEEKWLSPVAYALESELMWENLSKE